MTIPISSVQYFSACIFLLVWLCLGSISLNSQTKYLLHCNSDLLRFSEEIALIEIGTLEQSNKNDGEEIEKYQKSVGIPKFSSYCYAGQYFCFAKACKYLDFSRDSIPIPKSGLANSVFNFAEKKKVKAKYIAQKNDLIIWRSANLINGHIERIYKTGRAGWVTTIAFNTKNTEGKEGVFFKNRNIYHPLGSKMIRGLVGFYD